MACFHSPFGSGIKALQFLSLDVLRDEDCIASHLIASLCDMVDTWYMSNYFNVSVFYHLHQLWESKISHIYPYYVFLFLVISDWMHININIG